MPRGHLRPVELGRRRTRSVVGRGRVRGALPWNAGLRNPQKLGIFSLFQELYLMSVTQERNRFGVRVGASGRLGARTLFADATFLRLGMYVLRASALGTGTLFRTRTL